MNNTSWRAFFLVVLLVDLALCGWVFSNGQIPMLARWVPIGRPDEPVARIVGVTIADQPASLARRSRQTSVLVESAGGGFYRCCTSDPSGGTGAWEPVNPPPPAGAFFQNSCGPPEQSDVVFLTGERQHLGARWCGDWDSGMVIYALKADGTLWQRKTISTPLQTAWWLLVILGATAGLLLLALLVSYARRVSRRSSL